MGKNIKWVKNVLQAGRPFRDSEFYYRYGIGHVQRLFDKLYKYVPHNILSSIIPVDKSINEEDLFIRGKKYVRPCPSLNEAI